MNSEKLVKEITKLLPQKIDSSIVLTISSVLLVGVFMTLLNSNNVPEFFTSPVFKIAAVIITAVFLQKDVMLGVLLGLVTFSCIVFGEINKVDNLVESFDDHENEEETSEETSAENTSGISEQEFLEKASIKKNQYVNILKNQEDGAVDRRMEMKDEDGDNAIDRNEFSTLFPNHGNKSEEQLDTLFEETDTNGNESINRNELANYIVDRKMNKLDTNEDGKLSHSELLPSSESPEVEGFTGFSNSVFSKF